MARKTQFGTSGKMAPPAAKMAPGPDRRNAARDPLEIAVSLYSVAQSRVVLMLDISASGARIGGQALPGIGKDVLLTVAGVDLFGTVVRASDTETAITFDEPLDDAELDRLRSVLAEQTQSAMLYAR